MYNIKNKNLSKVTVLEQSISNTSFPTVEQGGGSEQKTSSIASVNTSNQIFDTREVKSQPNSVILPKRDQETLEKLFSQKCTLRETEVHTLICSLGGRVHYIDGPFNLAIFWGDSMQRAGMYRKNLDGNVTPESGRGVCSAIREGVKTGYLSEELIHQL